MRRKPANQRNPLRNGAQATPDLEFSILEVVPSSALGTPLVEFQDVRAKKSILLLKLKQNNKI